MLILQDKYSVTTLTTHEFRQSTYHLIASIFFYLKHQPFVPHKYDFEIISFFIFLLVLFLMPFPSLQVGG